MKILALLGSRNKDGRTARVVNAIFNGFTQAGGTTESIFLIDYNIERCRQCETDGWGICRREHFCVIKDDFDGIVTKMRVSDVIIFATPVYFGDLSEVMRSFLERFRRLSFGGPPGPSGPSPSIARSGQTAPQFPVIAAVGLCLAGGRGGNGPNCIASLDRILQPGPFDLIDMILL
jgi:multimeric flavodoxin WrbA